MKHWPSILSGVAVVFAIAVHLAQRPGHATSTATRTAPIARATRAIDPSEPAATPRPAPAPEPTDEDDAHAIAALRDDVASLQAEVASIRRIVRDQQRALQAAAPAPAPADLHAERASHAREERERREQMRALETQFRQETPDATWSYAAAGAVQTALAGTEALQDTLLGMECRAQTCRVELADDASGALSKAMPLFVQQLADTLPNVTADEVDAGDAGRSVVLYMSRDTGDARRAAR